MQTLSVARTLVGLTTTQDSRPGAVCAYRSPQGHRVSRPGPREEGKVAAAWGPADAAPGPDPRAPTRPPSPWLCRISCLRPPV